MIEREELRAAIDAHKTAMEAVTKNEATLTRAREFADKLSIKLAEFADLDERIDAARAATLKAAFATGEAPRFESEPEGFARDRIRRDRLAADLAACEASIEVLERELRRAQAEAARLDLAREHAAERVLAAEAEQMAVDFVGRLDELRGLSYLLNAIVGRQVRRAPSDPGVITAVPGHFYGTGPLRSARLPPIVHEAAREAILGEYELRHGFGLRKETSAAVADLWERLQADPDANLEEPQGAGG
jgi:hypothetical protein